ncbi:MAG: hypothetical protein ACI857_002796 [Arenicella sp.]|jgi:hypothetical protein
MKILSLLIGISLLSLNSFAQDKEQDIDSSQDEPKVKDAVVHWADSVFYMHQEYKFENFRAFYSEDYFIQVMRSRMYKERVEDLEKNKKAGRYKKSDAEYEKEHKELEDAYTKVQDGADNFKNRADYYQVSFWSNIQTNDGITVYYEHIVKLNNDYNVTEAIINSSIGKKSDATEILYVKDIKGGKKK